VEIAAAETSSTPRQIAGVNSAFIRDYRARRRFAADARGVGRRCEFFSTPVLFGAADEDSSSATSSVLAANSQPAALFLVHRPVVDASPDEVRDHAEAVIGSLPAALASVDDAKWKELVAGVRSRLEEKAEDDQRKGGAVLRARIHYDRDWNRREATLKALDTLTKDQAVAFLASALARDSGAAANGDAVQQEPSAGGDAEACVHRTRRMEAEPQVQLGKLARRLLRVAGPADRLCELHTALAYSRLRLYCRSAWKFVKPSR
jgi:hypothetical protein